MSLRKLKGIDILIFMLDALKSLLFTLKLSENSNCKALDENFEVLHEILKHCMKILKNCI